MVAFAVLTVVAMAVVAVLPTSNAKYVSSMAILPMLAIFRANPTFQPHDSLVLYDPTTNLTEKTQPLPLLLPLALLPLIHYHRTCPSFS